MNWEKKHHPNQNGVETLGDTPVVYQKSLGDEVLDYSCR